MKNCNILCLMKFGKRHHLESLLETGRMRFGPIIEFSSSDEKERGDQYEGASNIVNEQFVKITCDHPSLGYHEFTPAPNTLGKLIQFNDRPHCSFSSYAFTRHCFADNDTHRIDKRMLEFGDHVLVFHDPIGFLRLVAQKLRSLEIPFQMGLIDYQDFDKEGTLDVDFFSKTKLLDHQFEHRILIRTNLHQAEFIEIGSLKDFSVLHEAPSWTEALFTGKFENE